MKTISALLLFFFSVSFAQAQQSELAFEWSQAVPQDSEVILAENFYTSLEGAVWSLHWATSSEEGINRFEIERSEDGKNFQYIASVSAKGLAAQYFFLDRTGNALPTEKIYYRLIAITEEGQSQTLGHTTVKNKADYTAQ
jgi:hypothetical protein